MDRPHSRESNKKPPVLRALVLLLFIYGILSLITNLIQILFTESSGGSAFDITLSFGPVLDTIFTIIGFLIISVPAIVSLVAYLLISKGGRLGYLTSIVLLIPCFFMAVSGISYLAENLHLPFITENISLISWNFGSNDFSSVYTDSSIVYIIILIKSFLKAFIEILSFGLLLLVIKNHESYFQKK